MNDSSVLKTVEDIVSSKLNIINNKISTNEVLEVLNNRNVYITRRTVSAILQENRETGIILYEVPVPSITMENL